MGNYIAHQSSESTGKVILSDGTVFKFDKPLTVAELMLEYPQQVVVEFHRRLSEKRPAPLPADERLIIGKVYIMLPMKRGKPASLTSEETRHVVLIGNSVLRSRSFLSSWRFLIPLFAKMCPAVTGEEQKLVPKQNGCVQRPYASEFLLEIFETTRPEYLSRQLSGKGWKPNLDTIAERKVEKRVPHWLFVKG